MPSQMTHRLSAGKLAEIIRQGSTSTFLSMDPDEWKRIVQLRDEDGRTLIHTAAANGHLEIVQAMLMHGFGDLLDNQDGEGWTALTSACSSGHELVVRCLIAAGANPNLTNNGGRTALHYAASKGHLRIAQMLLEEGAKADVRDRQGALPLHRSCSCLQARTVKLFLSAMPGTVSAADNMGETPLHIVVSMGEDPRSVEIARTLVAHGADLEAKDIAGNTPLALFGGKLPSSIAMALEAEEDEEVMDT